LVCGYKFESGGFLVDASGNGHTLTNSGATQSTSGMSGDGAAFAYSGSLTASVTAQTGGYYMFSAWVNPASVSNTLSVVDYYSDANNDAMLRINGGGYPCLFSWGGSGDVGYASTTAISANTWTHLFGIIDETTWTVYLYVNGALVGTSTTSSGSTLSRATFMIGCRGQGGSYDGVIDEVYFWRGTSQLFTTAAARLAFASALYNSGAGAFLGMDTVYQNQLSSYPVSSYPALPITSLTAAATAAEGNTYIYTASTSAACTLTLPTPSVTPCPPIRVINNSSHTITLSGSLMTTAGVSTSSTTVATGTTLELVWDGTYWYQERGSSTAGSSTTSTNLLSRTSVIPTAVIGSGAGSGASVVMQGTDASGEIAVTTGTSPAAQGTVATITFNTAFATTPFPILSPASNTTANLQATTPAFATATTTALTITSGNTALTAGTTYVWNYHCF
jgi:hypothetical protein